jgi:hypothetical protein
MCGRGSGKLRGIGPGDEVSYTMQFHLLINHGGCHHHQHIANMRPHFWHQSTQQSAKVLNNRFALLKLGNNIIINSLTAMDGHDCQLFNKLHW